VNESQLIDNIEAHAVRLLGEFGNTNRMRCCFSLQNIPDNNRTNFIAALFDEVVLFAF
jgi:hypothetical protein